jgi:hypothetical protein
VGIFILANIYNKRIMKLIINERQLKLIEDHINEAKYDKTTMVKLGKVLLKLTKMADHYDDISLTTKNGNDLVLNYISNDNSTYVFSVKKDNAKLVKKFTNLAININLGNGEFDGDEEAIDVYLKNKNIITTDGSSFTLQFIGSNETLKNKYIKVNNIINFQPYVGGDDDSEDLVKPYDLDSGDTSTTGTTATTTGTTATTTGTTENVLDDAKIAYDMISKDPLLKKAFYSQPSFLNLFVAELTGKKAVGKGIYSVLNLVRRYNNKKYTDYLKAEFIDGKKISFIFLESRKIPSDNKTIFNVVKENNKIYKSEVKIELNSYPILISKNSGLTFELEIKDPIKGKKDSFSCILVINNSGKTYTEDNRIEIEIIRGVASPGYKPIAITTSGTTSGTTTTNTPTTTI